ncbi:hypothetical protein IAQ61_003168 [Plenodomus lingam]|uniref:uncharacterized protein n=1 Tax=Leptosphaeria maculans TaxID=5022 RepID=UPI003328135B|nr:hypothetical protein IAQ61_003168 [Plenodomus lingam]
MYPEDTVNEMPGCIRHLLMHRPAPTSARPHLLPLSPTDTPPHHPLQFARTLLFNITACDPLACTPAHSNTLANESRHQRSIALTSILMFAGIDDISDIFLINHSDHHNVRVPEQHNDRIITRYLVAA